MKHSKAILTAMFCAGAFIASGQAPDSSSTQPDNTKVNKRDRNASEATADQQKTSAADQEMTRQIRRSIMATSRSPPMPTTLRSSARTVL